MKSIFKNNINKLIISNFFTGMVLWYGIEKLFMQQIGISPFGIGINAAVFLLITVLLDVPSGVLADRWNRKYVLLLAMICLIFSTFVLGISDGLAMYLIGTVLYGFYIVLTSGTFQAIMYDSLHELGLEKEYDKYQGRAYALFLLGIAVSSLAGGYVSEWYGYRWAYFLSILFVFISFVCIALLKEPRFHKLRSDTKFLTHIAQSIKSITHNPIVFHLALFVVFAGLLRSTQNEFAGLYYIALGLTAIPTGYANAGKWLAGSFGQFVAERIGRRILLFIPLFFIIFLLFTLLESAWGILFFYAAVLLQSIMNNQAEAEIQDNTRSEIRATTLSLMGFASNIILIPFSLLFGWIASQYSAFAAYKMIAAIGLAYLVVWIFFGRKHIGKIT